MNTLTRAATSALSASLLAATVLGAGAGGATAATATPSATTHRVVTHAALTHASAKHVAAKHSAARHATAKHKTVKHKVVKKAVKAATKTPVTRDTSLASSDLTPFETSLFNDMNSARASAGLPELIAVTGATDVARRWSLQLAESTDLQHNPNLVSDMEAAGSGDWQHIDENVGTGPADDESDLFAAYMASPHHRANILDPATKYVGVGVIQIDDGQGNETAWNTVDFVDSYSNSYGANKTPALPDTMSLAAAEAAF